MFDPSISDVRNFFFDIYQKASVNHELNDVERTVFCVILEHPEYHHILAQPTKYLEYSWPVEEGQTNPFLHLSLHLTILEQISINQPLGIKELFARLCQKFGTRHEASHQLMDCITEMLWHAKRHNTPLDQTLYFNCIGQKLGNDSDLDGQPE